MREGGSFIGLIEFQRKLPWAAVHSLWVINPQLKNEDDAEIAAMVMLEHIFDITESNRVIYSDGIAL